MAGSGEGSAARNQARYLPALDGLRAFSVLAVIAFHADLAAVPGGFLGVEVFFVVSGYLITALLLLESRETGALSLRKFWLRRARRLLPALFALLTVTLFVCRWLAPDALAQTRDDAGAAVLYVSNWWQVIHHHSYFMAVQRPPLLLHLWSLAVEEQFYLFWPMLIFLLGRAASRWVAPVAIVGAVGSALWMAWLFDPSIDLTRLYIGTDSRLSGLLLGSALAAATRASLRLEHASSGTTRVCQEGLALAGVGALSWAFAKLTSHDSFVYQGGLLAVDLAACALIYGLVTRTIVQRCLATRPLAWLGRRSYGLYLWHWPIFAFTRPDQDVALSGAPLLGTRLLLTFLAAELCYRYVEVPVRAGALPALLRPLRARPFATGICAAVVVQASGLVPSAASRQAAARSPVQARVSSSAALALPLPATTHAVATARVSAGVALDPRWPKTLTLLSDSVTLAVGKALVVALPGWKVEVLGRPALMVKQVVPEFLNARSVGSVVVIGLGYNSLFEKDRANYDRWSGIWDRSAERLLLDLKACGAKKLVWVTLREPSAELVTDTGREQYREYAWFFPYVNERIRALADRHPELALADWAAVSDVPGLTKDLIHLSPAGVALMSNTITHAVFGPARPEPAISP